MRSITAFILSLLAFVLGVKTQPVPATHLQMGKPVLRAISPGEAHGYEIKVAAGQYLQIVVDGRSAEVSAKVAITTPTRQVIDELASLTGRGPLLLLFVSPAAGTCRVTVSSVQTGRYSIKLETQRSTASGDERRISAYSSLVSADKLLREGNKAEAEIAYRRVLDSDPADTFIEASAVLGLGRQYRSGGDAQKASDQFARAAKIFQTGGSWDELFRNLTPLYLLLGGKQQALDYLSKALPLVRGLKNERLEAILLLAIAKIETDLAKPQEALATTDQALELLRLTAKRGSEVLTLTDIGDADLTHEQKRQAIEYLKQAVLLSQGASDRSLEASMLFGIGYTYSTIDEYDNALSYFRQTLPIWHELKDKSGEAYAINFIGSIYVRLGDYDLASQHLEQARSLFNEIGDPRAEGYALVALATTDLQLGEQQKALERYTRALTIFQETGEKPGEAIVLSCLGSINWSRGARDAAASNYQRALTLYRSDQDRQGEANVLSALGLISQYQGQNPQAIELQNRALDIFRQLGDRSGEANARYGLARAKAAASDLDGALSDVVGSIAIIESIRGGIDADDLRTSYLASRHDVYGFYVNLLLQLNKARPNKGYDLEAFTAVEKAKARSLVDVLHEARADLTGSLSPALRDRERVLRQQISVLSRARGLLTDRQRIVDTDRQLDALTADYQKLRSEIRASSPGYESLMRPQSSSVDQLQRLLGSEDIVLEYWLGDPASYVWVVKSGSVKLVPLAPKWKIEAVARSFYEAAKAPENGARSNKLAADLGTLIIGPAGELSNSNIVVVPDGILWYIPFAALPRTAGAEPLIRTGTVSYLPSSAVPGELRQRAGTRTGATNSLAIFADPVFSMDDPRVLRRTAGPPPPLTNDPAIKRVTRDGVDLKALVRLPGTRREANTIFELAPDASRKKALDFDASISALKSDEISKYRVIHIATHGILDGSHPEFSGVILSLVDADGKPQNGFLRLSDIYNLKLSSDLVVLSACQTALGKDVKGEGVVGLSRGFMHAGSRRVVASLWPVDDTATAELMRNFYTGIFGEKHLAPSAALREAQLALMNDRRFSSPYYWAAFTLQGDWK